MFLSTSLTAPTKTPTFPPPLGPSLGATTGQIVINIDRHHPVTCNERLRIAAIISSDDSNVGCPAG